MALEVRDAIGALTEKWRQCCGSPSRTLAADWCLIEDEGKFSVEATDRLEGRVSRLDVRLARPCRNETKVGQRDGLGHNIAVAARRVDDRKRVASLLEVSGLRKRHHALQVTTTVRTHSRRRCCRS
jgi:hypothetical protein